MYNIKGKLAVFIILNMFLFFSATVYAGLIKGIYINQETMEDSAQLSYLIDRAKKVGIQTFIVDLELPSKIYEKNAGLLKSNGINYVARIVVFPGGGTKEQIHSESYWEKKLKLAKTAIAYGANQIQLDYIRYSSKQPPSEQNAQDILKIIKWFKARINVPLQIDVFGISSFGPSKWIG
ncbi:MAG TPA: putative glycoside hydrolase, partial [Gammaproteobacteria bacterium]|nr:putative glycoside hydrolase [Gammaproteobacteria bacterium]